MNQSARLKAERHLSFWRTGAFRAGNPRDRMAWITQRFIEQSPLQMVNPYLEAKP